MKIYVIGFRGTGFRDPRYKSEHPLIRAGHVGVAFEGNEGNIYGFSPTQSAVEQAGGIDHALELLKSGASLAGALQVDSWVFARANQLAQLGAATTVWQVVYDVSDEQFNKVRARTLEWYTEQRQAEYAFPLKPGEPSRHPLTHNCATFPAELGISLPEETGKLEYYIAELEKRGEVWHVPNS